LIIIFIRQHRHFHYHLDYHLHIHNLGGIAALTVGSGQAASAFVIQNLCTAGDNFISSTDLYGGTVNLFKNTLRDQGKS